MPGVRPKDAATSSVELNHEEVRCLAEFAQQHGGGGCSPNRFTVEATATGIGLSIEVTCHTCRKSANISDLASW